MNNLLISVIALVVTAGSAFADEQIRRIQEELRKRNLYFGEIDGLKTEQTTRALKHYQQRKGFPPTGEPDSVTLSSLNLAEAAPEAPPWPDVAVLKSDTAREIKEKDRKFLESLEPIAEPPNDETALSTPDDPGPPTEEDSPPSLRVPPPREQAPPPREETQQPPPKKESAPPAKDQVPPPPAPSKIPPERAEEFVRSYLDACESNQLASETAYYADKVKYFDHGVVDRGFIQRDVARFYKRWPDRSYELLDLKVLKTQGDEAVVKFRISFDYRSDQHKVAGKTDNVFTIRQAGDQMKFTALKEQRIRN